MKAKTVTRECLSQELCPCIAVSCSLHGVLLHGDAVCLSQCKAGGGGGGGVLFYRWSCIFP